MAVGVKLKESEWDDDKQRVKKNHPNSARMNAAISQKVADAEAQVADLERKVKSVSANKLKEAIKGKEIPNFFQFSLKRCENIRGSVSISTYRNYILYLKKFEDWVGTNDLCFDQVTVTLLKDYLAYMSNELNNGNTTQRYSIMILAIMFKEAIKEDIIPEYMYPFSKLNLKKDPTKRMFLSKEQIEALSKLELKDKAILARDLFIFAIYAGGLRFSDVIGLQYKHFNSEENRIKKTIRKTKREHQFKIGNTALGILNKYIKTNADKDDFIFPLVLNKKKFIDDEEFRQNFIDSSNHSINFQLNKIGVKLELPFSLSFHLSRHSFATTALNNGMRIEHVSKLMDHSDIRTTQIYAKILNEELDKAVDQFID